MQKVLYIQPLHPTGMEILREKYNVVVCEQPTRECIEREIVDSDAVITRLTEIDSGLIEMGKHLKVIGRHGVGVDNIDIACATKHHIPVVTTGNANSVSVAEHAFLAIGALFKKIPLLDKAMRDGDWAIRDKTGAADLFGKVLGVCGLGKIGSCIAHMAKDGFGMQVLVFDPYTTRENVEAMGYTYFENLDELLRRADAVTLHVPLTEQTRGLIDARRLRLMKPTAFLANFSRGGIVVEDDLYRALTEKVLAGAAIDAFEQEPPDFDSPLFSLDNVILSPHCGTFTEDSRIRMSVQLSEGVADVLEGKKPRFCANPF